MNLERIKEIQEQTTCPDSISVQQALIKVWQECESKANKRELLIDFSKWLRENGTYTCDVIEKDIDDYI